MTAGMTGHAPTIHSIALEAPMKEMYSFLFVEGPLVIEDNIVLNP